MAKPTGFLEFERETAANRPINERVNDWQPIHLHLSDAKLTTQAARCMDCGTPFCHTGRMLNGMTSGCPLSNLIPEWNDLVYQGLWREAYDRLSKTNNFPEFTGAACPAPCEAACTLGMSDPPVAIKSIELAIIDKAFAEGWVRPEIPAQRTGKRVAVIGSGPAGLACADQLNRVGHQVTVLERDDRIGGLLMYGIPNMKLDKTAVQRRVDLLTASGIEFCTNVEVGVDFIPRLNPSLREEEANAGEGFDAIVLATGASHPRDLPIEGRDLQGIELAVPFLTESTKRVASEDSPLDTRHPIDVVVIGGGDTGTDCVATALRYGCNSGTLDSVRQLEIMPRPPLERAADNPWPQWPRVFGVDYGQEEVTAVFGQDPRQYATMTKRFEGDDQGRVKAVHTVQVEWKSIGENGNMRRVPVEIPGTEKVWPAQLVLLALGFIGPQQKLLTQLGVDTNHQSVATDHHTNQPGVFIAGDARRGQSLLVWAIQDGRSAAREVDCWLMGETDLP